MKEKILILGGGISKERLISLETAKSVFKELKKKKYAVKICELMEFIAELAYFTEKIKVKKKLPQYIGKKHFERKFGKKSYYGQKH